MKRSARLLFYAGIIFALIFVMISRYLDKEIVRSIVRINSSLALITGGEYTLRIDIPSPPEFKQMSEYITACGNIRIPISFSVGMAVCPDEGIESESLIKLADERMYEDKRKRKLKLNGK